ncbi:MAG: hypothetical protein ABI821_00690 [Pseudomonadota bacterium]
MRRRTGCVVQHRQYVHVLGKSDAVVGGMITGTLLAIFFVPLLFVGVRKLARRVARAPAGGERADSVPAATATTTTAGRDGNRDGT